MCRSPCLPDVCQCEFIMHKCDTGVDAAVRCRTLSPSETAAYLAWQERTVDHPAAMIALLEDCIQEVPRMIAADASEAAAGEGVSDGEDGGGEGGGRGRRRDSVRRRSLALIAQKGSQMMRAVGERGGTPAAAWLEEAWALLAAAAVQFRRCAPQPPAAPARRIAPPTPFANAIISRGCGTTNGL